MKLLTTVMLGVQVWLFSGGLVVADTAGVTSGEQLLNEAGASVQDIDTPALQAQLIDSPETVVIDVRTADEITLLGGAIGVHQNVNIPRGWLEFRVTEAVAAKDTPIVVYCGTNQRSRLAAVTLMRMGYTRVRNYPGGYFAWRDAGLPIRSPDKAPDSILYDKPQQVADGVWSAIGATAPPTYENSGHNNNLSFIITTEGVLVVNAGDNYLLARALHEEIKKLTDQPVKFVVLENGQGHAMLGSNYWQEQDATVIAHADAAHEMAAHGQEILERMRAGRRDKAMGTMLTVPDRTFSEKMLIELGGERIELLNLGPAHSPGDIVVWLPQRSLVISGDMAFHQRLLPIFEHTDTRAWLETWDKLAALGAKIVIPGHGGPTVMAEVTQYTKDYLTHLHEKITAIIDDGGDLNDAYLVDQSAYAHLDTFDELARQNAGRVFRALEFE